MSAERILAENPEIGGEDAVRLIYEEVCLRRESGQDVPTSEVLARYPRWKDELEVLLGCDRLLRPMSMIATLPEIGEELGPFRLLAELGRGASGRTYLAEEPALADRLVVLKVISDDQEEHLSLARLQHTHIIPLFSEHSFPDRGLRALCMPYLGGTSLARVLEALSRIPPAERRGHDILEVLDRVEAGRVQPMLPDGPYRRYLERASYIQAICWIGACLADALHDAHAHGLVHMDVKPSNVLIAADGLPMLLDFHLARRPIRSGERFPDRIGGTPGWMAPEHAATLEAVGLGQPVPASVDHRADVYSLGLLLRESLGGTGAASFGEKTPRLRRSNPEVSIELDEIIRKCLDVRPSGRHRSAADLADDLRRHLSELPLREASGRSDAQGKRTGRRPHTFNYRSAALLLLFALVMAGIAWFLVSSHRQRIRDIRATLEDGRVFCSSGRYDDAIHALRKGLQARHDVSGVGRPLAGTRGRARRGRAWP